MYMSKLFLSLNHVWSYRYVVYKPTNIVHSLYILYYSHVIHLHTWWSCHWFYFTLIYFPVTEPVLVIQIHRYQNLHFVHRCIYSCYLQHTHCTWFYAKLYIYSNTYIFTTCSVLTTVRTQLILKGDSVVNLHFYNLELLPPWTLYLSPLGDVHVFCFSRTSPVWAWPRLI